MIVNTTGPIDAKIFLVGDVPGKEESTLGNPFVGTAGKTLTYLCSQAGFSRYQCLIGNVAKECPPGNNISYYFEDKKCTIPKLKLKEWIEELRKELILYKPNIIVALGGIALWALTEEKVISNFRGTILPCKLVPGIKVLPTFHPRAVNYNWELFFTVLMDLRKAHYHSKFSEIPVDKRELLIANEDQFIEYCNEMLNNPKYSELALDIETSQPGAHISVLGLSHDKNFGISTRILSGKGSAISCEKELRIWQLVSKLCKKKSLIMHNGSYDTGVLLINNKIHAYKNLRFDTLLAMHCCWPESRRDLGYCASILLDVPAWKHTSQDNHLLYNAADACNTYALKQVLQEQITKLGVQHTFDFEMSEIPVALMMQLQGMKIDMNVRDELVKKSKEECKNMKELLKKILGKEINYSSSKQMQQLLYIDLGLPVQYKRRKTVSEPKKITAGAAALKKLAQLAPDNEIFRLILAYKKHQKLLSSFLFTDSKGKQKLSPNNTVHTCYNITGSSSEDEEGNKSFGRWSSSKSIILPYGSGNFQNIPDIARTMYKADPGHIIIGADYVQGEAVFMSYLINDARMKRMFVNRRNAKNSEKKNYDVHKQTASLMFDIPVEEITKEQRTIGKTLRHAVSYCAGPKVVAAALGCNLAYAKKALELYHHKFPQLRMYYNQIQHQLGIDRILFNPFNRRHPFMDRWGDSLFRSAYAFKPQSGLGDLMNRSLVRMYNTFGDHYKIILQLHDATYIMAPKDKVKEVVKLMRECMTEVIIINNEEMIVEVDFKVGESWGKMIDYIEED